MQKLPFIGKAIGLLAASLTLVLGTAAGPVQAAPHHLSIQFDYRFARGYFDDPQKRRTLEAAANVYSQLITDDFPPVPAGTVVTVYNPNTEANESVRLTTPIDDVLVFVFVTERDPGLKASAGPAGSWQGKSDSFYTRYNRKPFQPWLINLNINGKGARPWFFDQTPESDDDIPSRTHYDFFQTVLHELGHGLGHILLDPPFAFTDQARNNLFYGPHVLAWNKGQPVPLEKDSSHIRWDFHTDLVRPDLDRYLMHGPDIVQGFRAWPTALDMAFLQDIGYHLDPQAAQELLRHSQRPDPDPGRRAYLQAHPDWAKDPLAPYGIWRFTTAQGTRSSVVGYPLQYMPPPVYPVTHTLQPLPDGGVVIPQDGYLIVDHGIPANGGGKYVNKYSLLTDIRLPRINQEYSLHNCNYSNANGGEAFISPSNQLGQGNYSNFRFQANRWYRVLLTVDIPKGRRQYFVDGQLVLTQSLSAGDLDGRFSLDPLMLLFAGNETHYGPIHLRQAAIYGYALSEAQAQALGNVNTGL